MKKKIIDVNNIHPFFHKKYGEYRVVEYISCEKVKIRFSSTGYEYYTSMNHINNHEVKDRLYKNKFGANIGSRINDMNLYNMWVNMLYRSSQTVGAYKNVFVSKEWLDYSNFEKWAKMQYYKKGWHLDKDILERGNLEYSPQKCCFIPSELNTFFEKSNNAKGYGLNRGKTKYVSFVRDNGAKVHLGTFSTKEEAREAYTNAKKRLLDNLIKKYEGVLSDKIIKALKTYF